MKKNNKKGFTLIELLVVVLILGILIAVALPSYLSSVKESRIKTANTNARAIATAVQSLYVKNNGVSYATAWGSGSGAVVTEMSGSIPNNPCSETLGAGGYTIAADTTTFSITPKDSGVCTGGSALATISLAQ